MANCSKISPFVVQKGLVDTFYKKQDNSKLKIFLEAQGENWRRESFDSTATYCSFLSLVKEKIPQADPIYQKTIKIFQKNLGLPENLFTNDGILIGSDGTELGVSRELFEISFGSSLGPIPTGALQFAVPVNKEALDALKTYLLSRSFDRISDVAIQQLIDLGVKTNDQALQDAARKAAYEPWCDEKNEEHLDVDRLKPHFAAFTETFLRKKGITSERTKNGRFKIHLTDFLNLFQRKESKICKILADQIDVIIVDPCDFNLLRCIPSRFRRAICALEGTYKYSQSQLDTLKGYFPNTAQARECSDTQALRKAIASNASDWLSLSLLADLRLAADITEAEALSRQAINHNPKDAVSRLCLGKVLLERHAYKEAETVLRQAVALDPKNAEAHDCLGVALFNQMQFEEAERECKHSLELKEDSALTHADLGDLYFSWNKLDAAESQYRRTLTLKEDPITHAYLGDILFKKKKYAQAEREYRRAIELDKDKAKDLQQKLDTLLNIRKKEVEAVNQLKTDRILQMCAEAIEDADLTFLQYLVLPESEQFWEPREDTQSLLHLASRRLQAVFSTPDLEQLRQPQQDILALLHIAHAKYLQRVEPEKRAAKQLQTLIHLGETCGDILPEVFFTDLTKAYVPSCPYSKYVPPEDLDKRNPEYNSNQYHYAEWCYITSQAIVPLVKKRDFKKMICEVGRSRNIHAKVCKTPSAEMFGEIRTIKKSNITFTNTKNPWDNYIHAKWVQDPSFTIFAVGKDGTRVPGTRFGMRYSRHRHVRESFCALHSAPTDFPALEKLCQEWLEEVMTIGSRGTDDEEFYRALGAFFHTMCQLTLFNRGSAACSEMTVLGVFSALERSPPEATRALDWYALTMQQEEFIENVFIPWCKGSCSPDDLLQRLKALMSR